MCIYICVRERVCVCMCVCVCVIKICGKLDEAHSCNGFSNDISFFIQGRTSSE